MPLLPGGAAGNREHRHARHRRRRHARQGRAGLGPRPPEQGRRRHRSRRRRIHQLRGIPRQDRSQEYGRLPRSRGQAARGRHPPGAVLSALHRHIALRRRHNPLPVEPPNPRAHLFRQAGRRDPRLQGGELRPRRQGRGDHHDGPSVRQTARRPGQGQARYGTGTGHPVRLSGGSRPPAHPAAQQRLQSARRGLQGR